MVSTDLLKKVVNELVGPEALDIVLYLKGKEKISEFKIAKDLKMEIHQVRNILYRCLRYNILRFRRKKDKAKGWYISYWGLNEREIPFIYKKLLEEKVQKLRERLEREEGTHFYLCRNACIRADFETAADLNFTCPECGEILELQDNRRTIEFLKSQIKKLEEELESIEPVTGRRKRKK
ncbi:hypothetical protein J7K74_01095 [Candidatus Woesearchaeota archaeon]|nr:hypothetical protein [Candidatus Woesearchaeota archaeon]